MLATGIPHQVCIVLDCVLLLKVWEEAQSEKDHRVSLSITAQVMLVVGNLGMRNRLEARINLIRRRNIDVSNINAKLYVFEIFDYRGDGDSGGDLNTNRRAPRIKAGKQATEIQIFGSKIQWLYQVIVYNVEHVATPSTIISCTR